MGVSSSRRSLFSLCTLAGVVACARIAGLDEGGSGASLGLDAGAQTTSNGATIYPDHLTISAGCGVRADSEDQIAIQNGSAVSLAYKLESSDASLLGFVLPNGSVATSITGTVPPGQVSSGVKVSVTSAAAGTHPATVLVNVGDSQRLIPVSVTVQGGTLLLSPSVLAFGQVRKQTNTSQNITVSNTGTTAVTIDSWTGQTADLTLAAGALTIAAGASHPVAATLAAGPAGLSLTTAMTPHTLDRLCGTAPSVTLSGTRIDTSVTVTGSIDFGDVSCGATITKPVTISNFGPQQATFHFDIPPGSYFGVDVVDGTVPGANPDGSPATTTVNLRVNAQTAPSDPHTEQLVVETPGDTATSKTISASATIRGAVLQALPGSLTFDKKSQKQSFVLTNTGNQFIYVTFGASGGFTADSSAAVFAGFPSSVNVNAPSSSGNHTGALTMSRADNPIPPFLGGSTSGAICGNAPTVSLSGKGN